MRAIRLAQKELGIRARQLIERARSHCERTERMRESRMFGRRERKVGEAELTQTPQALHRRQIEQPRLGGLELDEVMYRVEYTLQRTPGLL